MNISAPTEIFFTMQIYNFYLKLYIIFSLSYQHIFVNYLTC